jgi:thiol-disulfide isomerase/thioredoxin
MNLQKIIFTCGILISFSSVSQINIAINHHGLDDGSSALKKEDSLHIKEFNINDYGKEVDFNEKSNIDFELVDADQLKQICLKSNYTWVFLQSSWCGACVSGLNKARKIVDSLKYDGISIVVVNQDILIKQLQKKILMEKYKTLTYILDPKKYGTIETKKQEQFIHEISKDYKIQNPGAVPKSFFLDKNGELVYFDTSYALTTKIIYEMVLKK